MGRFVKWLTDRLSPCGIFWITYFAVLALMIIYLRIRDTY